MHKERGGIEFPPLNNGAYILQFLDELGYCRSGFNGLIPLDFTEINAYIQSTNTQLLPFEVLLLKKLSNIYVSQSNDKNINSHAPYTTKPKQGMSAQDIKNAFMGIATVKA